MNHSIKATIRTTQTDRIQRDPWQDRPLWKMADGEPSYKVVDGGRAIYCRYCDRTSWNTEDVRHLFCAGCNTFHHNDRDKG